MLGHLSTCTIKIQEVRYKYGISNSLINLINRYLISHTMVKLYRYNTFFMQQIPIPDYKVRGSAFEYIE